MVYNLTNISEVLTFPDFLVEANKLSNGTASAAFLFVFFIVMFISFQRFEPKEAFLVSSFATTIVASLFVFIGLMGWSAVVASAIVLSISVLIKVWFK